MGILNTLVATLDLLITKIKTDVPLSKMSTVTQDVPLEAPDKEAAVKRNPHKDFASVQASRESYNQEDSWQYLQSPNTEWKIGDGANNTEWKKHEMVSIDPYDPKRECQYDLKPYNTHTEMM